MLVIKDFCLQVKKNHAKKFFSCVLKYGDYPKVIKQQFITLLSMSIVNGYYDIQKLH